MRRDEKGFTLIELLIVVIILGILAMIGIPKFLSNKGDAEISVCKTNLSALEDAEEQYHFIKGAYTTLQTDLVSNGCLKGAMSCPAGGTYTFTDGSVTCNKTGHTIH